MAELIPPPSIDVLSTVRSTTGESPVWDAEYQRLYWVDIPAGAVLAHDLVDDRRHRWQVPGPIGSIGLTRDGRLLLALQTGVYLFTPQTGTLELLADPEQGRPNQRLNDGKVGPDGAFWVGSMGVGLIPPQPVGTLYRITPDGHVSAKVGGLYTSNGLAWSGDGRIMFHSDSRGQWIDRYRFDAKNGQIDQRTRIATLTEAAGRPDGAAVDADGFYWSCGVSAGCLNRFSPDGALVQSFALPVAAPTMPCFGGPDMRSLFITSLRPPGDDNPLNGAVLHLRLPIAGVPVHRFEAVAS